MYEHEPSTVDYCAVLCQDVLYRSGTKEQAPGGLTVKPIDVLDRFSSFYFVFS